MTVERDSGKGLDPEKGADDGVYASNDSRRRGAEDMREQPPLESAGKEDAEKEAEPRKKTCPECGAQVEEDARYCTQCAAPLTREAKKEVSEEETPEGLEPWAYRAGKTISKIPRCVKIWFPLAVMAAIAVVVALLVIASLHSPSAAVKRYLGELKAARYGKAYDMLLHPGGRFSSQRYFEDWQRRTCDALGRLKDFRVKPRSYQNRLFGQLLAEKPIRGEGFVATLKYEEKTFDVNITVEESGGFWPFRSYRLKLSDGTNRVMCSARDAKVYVDGVYGGKAKQSQALADALSLGDLPGNLDDTLEYARKLVRTARYAVEEFKRIARDISRVAEYSQRVFDRFGTSGTSWIEVATALEGLVRESKDLGAELARAAIHIYWIFGGGNDGTVLSELTRAQWEVELENLPEGYHELKVLLPGCVVKARQEDGEGSDFEEGHDTVEYYAPGDPTVELVPTVETRSAMKGAVEAYFRERADALFTLVTDRLPLVAGGRLLEQDMARVVELGSKGMRIASDLKALKFDKFKVLSGRYWLVRTEESWSFTNYEGAMPRSIDASSRETYVYTLEKADGTWKVIERKKE